MNKAEYFTSPDGTVNYCNECEQPILKKDGRFHVNIEWDFYSCIDGKRVNSLYGYKTFCHKCFEELFGSLNFKDAESIYRKEVELNRIGEIKEVRKE